MFTGIIQGKAVIHAIIEKKDFRTHQIIMPDELLEGLALGASVAHNGVCLTVTEIDKNLVSFDLMQATLALTNLSELQVGDDVNIERAMKLSDEIGGHLLSGHVFTTALISDIVKTENNYQLWFTLPVTMNKYILTKGYIGIDGISLTIGEVNANEQEVQFCVNLIPETLQRTTIASKQIGDKVNIEIDTQTQAIVDTVERYLNQKLASFV